MWKWMWPALLWYLNKMSESPSVMSSSFRHHGLYSPWASPGQTSGVGNLPFSRASSQLRGWAQVSRMAGEFFTVWASWRWILYCLSLLKADSLLSEPPEGRFFTVWASWRRILYCLSLLKVDSLPAEPQGSLIPETGEPGGLPSMGSHRVGHDWSDLAPAAAINF